jgi:hypothetical protein
MVLYFIRCPAFDWQSPNVPNRYEADRLMAEHVRRVHPEWNPRTIFRRETAE